MLTVLLALVVGVAFGVATKMLNLPLPAPNAFAGIVCVAGVYVGAVLVGVFK